MTAISQESAGPIIKSDRTGRTRYRAEYKQEVLAAFASSSLGAPEFARQCGIKYPTFASWIAKPRAPREKQALPGAPTFLIAELAGFSGRDALEVQFPGGAVARAADSAQVKLLAELLRHLA